jgi:hypothetical protein
VSISVAAGVAAEGFPDEAVATSAAALPMKPRRDK